MTRKENVIRVMRQEPPLWTPNLSTDIDLVLQSAVMERYEGRGVGKDEFGVTYQYNKEARGPVQCPGDRVVKEIENWRDYVVFPDLENRDWESAARRDTAGWDRKNKFSVVQMFNGMFERSHMLMGYEDTLCALLTDADVMEDFYTAFTDYRIGMIRKIAEYYKPDAVMVFDDYAAKDALMMSVETWRELFKGQLKRLIDAVHECGMYYILHCCGYLRPLLEDFIEIGADAVHPVQAENQPQELKQKYKGQITFCGCYDNVHILDREGAADEEIVEEARHIMEDIAPGGSFIAWQSFFCQNGELYRREIQKYIDRELADKKIEIERR